MIKVYNLKKIYSGSTVLDLPDLAISRGEVFGLVGNNGAGKTTFFSLVLDLIRVSEGKIISNELEVSRTEEWKSYTGAYIDESFTIGYLTPDEYFNFLGDLRNMNKNDINNFLSGFESFFNGEIIGKKKFIRDLSKGNQKKVGVIGAFIGNPDVIVLDEPFANLDPSAQYKLRDLIKAYAVSGDKTMLISSHDLDHVADVSTRIVILEHGKVVKDVPRTSTTLKELEQFFTSVKEERAFLDEF